MPRPPRTSACAFVTSAAAVAAAGSASGTTPFTQDGPDSNNAGSSSSSSSRGGDRRCRTRGCSDRCSARAVDIACVHRVRRRPRPPSAAVEALGTPPTALRSLGVDEGSTLRGKHKNEHQKRGKGSLRYLEAIGRGAAARCCEDTALSVESNSTLITESSMPPPCTSGMGLTGPH
eukprot:351328-Chlamydomonas_euryale.AAC.15